MSDLFGNHIVNLFGNHISHEAAHIIIKNVRVQVYPARERNRHIHFRYVTSRWLTLRTAVDRFIEQR